MAAVGLSSLGAADVKLKVWKIEGAARKGEALEIKIGVYLDLTQQGFAIIVGSP